LLFAWSLCASCTKVCPVKVDLHEQLYLHRQDVVDAGLLDKTKQRALKIATYIMQYPLLMDMSGKMARKLVPLMPRWIVYSKFNVRGKNRELPKFPRNSFKELYKARKK
ncbi:MAG: 4Fe-4S ferredoxin, partial [Campylobacteraceae bacterium]|nr:4Fe-4S ferredoxin [Campylobacteraceae bacterium]